MRSSQTNTPVVSVFEPITRDNIADRIPEAAQALGLSPKTVEELVAHEQLSQAFFDKALCNAGNDALMLDNIKRQIAANLQTFAHFVFNNHNQNCINAKNEFNLLFESIARITDEKNLELDQDFQERCLKLSLDELEALLTKVYFSELIRKITGTRIQGHLLALNYCCKLTAVKVVQEKAQFTDALKSIVAQKDKAIADAANLAKELNKLKAAPRKLSAPSAVAVSATARPAQRRESSDEQRSSVKRKSTDPSDIFEKTDASPVADAAPPAKKARFWQSEIFRRYATGLVLFAGICLLGAGIAFTGGALGLGLIFAGLAVAGIGAVMAVYNNKKAGIPTPFPAPISHFNARMYLYLPPSKRRSVDQKSFQPTVVPAANPLDQENKENQPEQIVAAESDQRFARRK